MIWLGLYIAGYLFCPFVMGKWLMMEDELESLDVDILALLIALVASFFWPFVYIGFIGWYVENKEIEDGLTISKRLSKMVDSVLAIKLFTLK